VAGMGREMRSTDRSRAPSLIMNLLISSSAGRALSKLQTATSAVSSNIFRGRLHEHDSFKHTCCQSSSFALP
jgi:hypothetical protein